MTNGNEATAAAVKMIYKKMALILEDIDAIAKDKSGAGFKYRGIDDVYNELHSSFAKHSVFCTTNVLSRTQEERTSKNGGALFFTVCEIRFTFYAEDGSSVTSSVIGEAMDSGDKGTNKCMAIAHKYALMQAFLIPTQDDSKDPDSVTHEVERRDAPDPTRAEVYTATEKQVAFLKDLLRPLVDADYWGKIIHKRALMRRVPMVEMREWVNKAEFARIASLRRLSDEIDRLPPGRWEALYPAAEKDSVDLMWDNDKITAATIKLIAEQQGK